MDVFGGVRVALVPCQTQRSIIRLPQDCSGQNDGIYSVQNSPFQMQLQDEDIECELLAETYAVVWGRIFYKEYWLDVLMGRLDEIRDPEEKDRIIQEIFDLIVEVNQLHAYAQEVLDLAETLGCDTSKWRKPGYPGPDLDPGSTLPFG